MEFIEALDKIDVELFVFIHSTCSSVFLDPVMLLLRKAEVWIPLYLLLFAWIIRKNSKMAIPFLLFSLATFAITDYVSASVLKPLFERPRPCYDENLRMVMRYILECGGRFGLPSSHASNHFGLAAFWFPTIRLVTNRKMYWLWLWAALICYAQVYVGKHYPLDVVAGGLFGTVTGYTMYNIYARAFFRKKELVLSIFNKTRNRKSHLNDPTIY